MVETSKGSAPLASVFKALSDPHRLAIFELIRDRCGSSATEVGDAATTVSRLAEEFDLALSTVSHHLKELRRAGLITCERRGQQVFCGVAGDALARVAGFASSEASAVGKDQDHG